MTATTAMPRRRRRDLASPLAEALTRASWRLRRASVKELAPLGLTFAQSRVLRILARRDEPMRMGDLAARFEVAPRSATSMIDSLEALGLVERRADPTDRRSVLVGLTPDGLALMDAHRRAAARQRRGAVRPPHAGAAAAAARDAPDACSTSPRTSGAAAGASDPGRRPPEPDMMGPNAFTAARSLRRDQSVKSAKIAKGTARRILKLRAPVPAAC